MDTTKYRRVVAFAAPLLLVFTAQMQSTPADSDAPNTETDILRGPTVAVEEARSLVQRDAMGRFVPIADRPEEIAITVVPIDINRRHLARDVIATRRTALGMHLVEHVDILKEATDAMLAGENERAQKLYRDIYEKFEPEQGRDPLLEPLAEVLSADEFNELKRLVDEYWQAWTDWELRDQMQPAEEARAAVAQRLEFTMFQQEISRAYEWSIRPYQQKLQYICEIVETTPEQRSAIRSAIVDHIRETKLQSTPEQRQLLTQRIYDTLDEQQRLKLFELIVRDL